MSVTVYVESSVISYLASRPSRDLVTVARQAITVEWWEERRHQYEVYISALVEEEISKGDLSAAERRLAYVAEIPALDVTDQANASAKDLLRRGVFLKIARKMPCIAVFRLLQV